MIGLKFKVKNEYNNYLFKILNSIDVEQYEWEIVTDDIIDAKSLDRNNGIFGSHFISGQSFLKNISKENYYMIFVDLKAFLINGVYVEIKTLDDFFKSDCQLILLCIDSVYIEIYCKERLILNTVYNNCIRFGFDAVEYITTEIASNRSMIAF